MHKFGNHTMTDLNKAGNKTKSLGEKLQHKIGGVFHKKNATKPATAEYQPLSDV